MLSAMKSASAKGFLVAAILSHRHSEEIIDKNNSLFDAIRDHGFPVLVVNEAREIQIKDLGEKFATSLALCFGPAWIFPAEVIKQFFYGMFNFNGIPLPKYLGGAHYTWQILNGDRSSGRYIQCINEEIDRGDILLGEEGALSKFAKTPEDYFNENNKLSIDFINKYLDLLSKNYKFSRKSFGDMEPERMYFPRLVTEKNGWIDWSWNGSQIELFCNAFSYPYSGAQTYFKDQKVSILEVEFNKEISVSTLHPFCNGLIVRKCKNKIFVAVEGGLLEISKIKNGSHDMKFSNINEGDRFYTDHSTLFKALSYRPVVLKDGGLR